MRSMRRIVGVVGAIVGLAATLASAQTTATTTETKKFEVIAVNGNELVVRLPEGTRELTVADDFRFTVDGKQLSVRELKPGMAGTATITTRTTVTPVTVTEIKNGTVAQVAGSSIIVRTDEGFRAFSQGEIDKRGIKIYRSGKPAQLSDFRAGDRLSATIVTSLPPRVVTEKEVQATTAAPAAAATRAGAGAPAGAAGGGAAAGGAAQGTAASRTTSAGAASGSGAPAARKLPKTAGPLPLLGVVGLSSLAIGAGLAIRRRRYSR